LLGDSLQAVANGVHLKDPPNNARLIFADFKAHASDERPTVLVDARGVFDRHIAIAEAAATGVQAVECLALDAAMDFLSKLF
jgi:hypothetical protein